MVGLIAPVEMRRVSTSLGTRQLLHNASPHPNQTSHTPLLLVSVNRVIASQISLQLSDPVASTGEDALLIYTKLSEPNHDESTNCHAR
jgi:hypothetical protein